MDPELVYKLNYVCGLPFNPSIPENRLDELATFPLRPDDLFIVTFPKSGTTWTQQIVKLIKGNGIEDDIPLSHCIPWLEKPAINIEDLSSPRAFKSHTNYEFMPGGEPAKSPAKYIYIARNPKDTAVSLYYHARSIKAFEFTGDWNAFFKFFITGRAEGGSWFNHVLEWWNYRDASNILFLKFEDMKDDLKLTVEKIAEFMNIQLQPEIVEKIVSLSTFDNMKVNPAANMSWIVSHRREGSVPFFRKGIVGDWKNHFTEDQLSEFDDEYARLMAGTGLDFKFE